MVAVEIDDTDHEDDMPVHIHDRRRLWWTRTMSKCSAETPRRTACCGNPAVATLPRFSINPSLGQRAGHLAIAPRFSRGSDPS